MNIPMSPAITGQFPVRFRAGGHADVTGQADQASVKGLFIHTVEVHPVNTVLALAIDLPEAGREIKLTARVVYSNPARPNERSALPPGMGVKYVDPSRHDLTLLEGFLESVEAGEQDGLIKIAAAPSPPPRRTQPAADATERGHDDSAVRSEARPAAGTRDAGGWLARIRAILKPRNRRS